MKKMKKERRVVFAVLAACVFLMTPLFGFLSPAASMTVSAHGRHGGGHHAERHHNASPEYYYCHGHEAHLHDGGVCPYADCYNNGTCPYADGYNNEVRPYTDDYDNGALPYADGYGGTMFSHGCFNHMNSTATPRHHCRFLIPTAMGISLL